MTAVRRLAVALVLVLLLTGAVSAGLERPIRVYLNGEPLALDVPPRMIDGRVWIPARSLGEALGLRVLWDESLAAVIFLGARPATLEQYGRYLATVVFPKADGCFALGNAVFDEAATRETRIEQARAVAGCLGELHEEMALATVEAHLMPAHGDFLRALALQQAEYEAYGVALASDDEEAARGAWQAAERLRVRAQEYVASAHQRLEAIMKEAGSR